MRKISSEWKVLVPGLALAVGSAAGAAGPGEMPRALALSVIEHSDHVELELIARSDITQQVEYKLELVGSSTARHSGKTSIEGGKRHVLSRLDAGFSENWCAIVDVVEGNGARYTLRAGDCSQG